MRSVLPALCLFASTAHAVPGQFTHQGKLLDADGVPLEGEATIKFRVIDSEEGGATLWEETLTVPLSSGFYSAVLGTDEEDNPLDVDILSQAPVWLELQLDGEPAMFPRSPIHAVPYATLAGSAEEVTGGPVDASVISVGGTPVVSESGEWVGPAPTINWADIEDVPAAFADGTDTDTLAALGTSCIDGDVPVWDEAVATWVCGMDVDTLAAMDCLHGQLVLWSDDTSGWICSDTDFALSTEVFTGSFLDLADLPEGLLDGDTTLTEEEVDEMVSNNGYAMSAAIFSGSFADLTGVPDGLADGDTTLTETEVDEMVSNNGYALSAEVDPQIDDLLAEIETLKDQYAALEATVEESTGSTVGTVMYGNYTISNSVDLASMEGFTEITGDLEINAGDIPNLAPLSSLTRVGGNLTISNNGALTDLAGLSNVASVDGYLHIDTNASLASLAGLNNLTEISRWVAITNNDSLLSISGLNNLSRINEELTIRNNRSLIQIDALSLLEFVGTLYIIKNTSLQHLDGLSSLETVVSSFNVNENILLNSISGLSSLTSAGSPINMYQNYELCQSDGDAFLARMRSLGWIGSVSIHENKAC